MGLSGKLVRGEDGQASLMIGMMMLTFILFFAFVVNTGMLVSAKINLQNAADLAAYSGAAVQARQLNTISYLNYEMRRQYKKFLFRYYVLGNMAQAKFPRGAGQAQPKTPYLWSPDGSQQFTYGIPVVCIVFDSKAASNDNYCQLATLPKVNIPPSNSILDSFDMINQTLNAQLQAIEKIRQANCGAIANANLNVLLLWLFNTDPNLETLPSMAGQNLPEITDIMNISRAIANGIGLVPREIILHERINTLASYVNTAPQTGVTRSQVTTLESSQDPASNERTIQAFLSAYNTLGEHTYDPSQIEMDELLPSGQSNLLKLNLVQQNIVAYAVRYLIGGSEPGLGTTNPGDCVPVIQPVSVNQVPLGVSKDPSTLTYYALRLKATAKLMFSPFGDLELKAYAAARPFGSRIGPPVSFIENQFGYQGTPQYGAIPGNSVGGPTGLIPNLALSADEPATSTAGWNDSFVLESMYQQMMGGAAGGGGGLSVGQTQFQAGIQAAMSPNPIEGNLYNIINDLGNDPMVKNFDTNNEATLWAPIVSPAQQSNLKDVLQQDLQTLFSGTSAAGAGAQTSSTFSSIQSAITQDIISYAGKIQSGAGEPAVPGGPGESMNLVRLQNPFVMVGVGGVGGANGANGSPLQIPDVTLTDITQVKTSYVNTLDSKIQGEGRVGYSVKIISFDSLLNPIAADGFNGVPNNTKAVQNDAEAGQDVPALKH